MVSDLQINDFAGPFIESKSMPPGLYQLLVDLALVEVTRNMCNGVDSVSCCSGPMNVCFLCCKNACTHHN